MTFDPADLKTWPRRFVDGEDVVRGELIDDPGEGWMAKVFGPDR